MILLMTLAYSSAIFQGTELRKKQVQKYVSRRKEPKKKYRRRSTFGVGVDAKKWVDYLEQYAVEIQQLMKLTPSKRRFYEQGLRAATLIRSISIASLSPPQDLMSDRLTIISRSGRVFEMGDCGQVLLANPPLQKSRSLDRT
jgi:hypothetical protein